MTEIDKQEHKKFIRKQKQQQMEFKKKEALLLSDRNEVKRISDLIMLELKVCFELGTVIIINAIIIIIIIINYFGYSVREKNQADNKKGM